MTTSGDSLESVDTPPAWPPVRHPFQISTMGALVALATGWLVSERSRAAIDLFGPLIITTWTVILLVSALCGLVSAALARRDEPLSLLLERLCLIGSAAYSVIYLIALYDAQQIRVWVTEIVFLLIASASVWRLWQVQARIRWLKRVGRPYVPTWMQR